MSNPEKKSVDETEAEKEDFNEQSSDEEELYPASEIVVALPALNISRSVDEEVKEEEAKEQEARLNEQAVVAAALVVAAAEEAATKGKSDDGGSGGKRKKQKVSRMRKLADINDEVGGSGEGETKKPRKKSSELTHPPPGPPVCNVCGKGFGSWKAVFGHLRSHKDRNYQGFNPPPTFSAAADKFTIPGVNSAFVLVTAEGGSGGGGFAFGGASGSGSDDGRRLEIDLNIEPIDENEEEPTEGENVDKLDLNKSPPKDEEGNEKAKGR